MKKHRPKPHQCPSWSIKGGSYIEIPEGPTKWDTFLLEENLEEGDIGNNNSKVEKFIQKNWDKFYIPTKVLKMYGMDWEM